MSTEATFTFSTDETGATFECSLDGAAFAACTSPQSYPGLGVGSHTFQVRAVDGAGNTDPTPDSFTWTVSAPPVLTTVSCGQVLTQSTLLDNDLVDCPGDGLVIGAHGITIDLNDHTIDGTNLGFGIRNDGFDSVTITNGTVNEFDVGVFLNTGSAANIVSTLTLQLNQVAGVQLSNADDGVNGNISPRRTPSPATPMASGCSTAPRARSSPTTS